MQWETKILCDLLFCDTRFPTVGQNRTHSTSKACYIYFTKDAKYVEVSLYKCPYMLVFSNVKCGESKQQVAKTPKSPIRNTEKKI